MARRATLCWRGKATYDKPPLVSSFPWSLWSLALSASVSLHMRRGDTGEIRLCMTGYTCLDWGAGLGLHGLGVYNGSCPLNPRHLEHDTVHIYIRSEM
jgi:hypothetical protein